MSGQMCEWCVTGHQMSLLSLTVMCIAGIFKSYYLYYHYINHSDSYLEKKEHCCC